MPRGRAEQAEVIIPTLREVEVELGRGQDAVRQGDWRLVKTSTDIQPALYNPGDVTGEKHDLATSEPVKVKALQAL